MEQLAPPSGLAAVHFLVPLPLTFTESALLHTFALISPIPPTTAANSTVFLHKLPLP